MQATWFALCRKVVPFLVIPVFAVPVLAQNRPFDIGLRLNAVGGSGKPTNDVLGAGVFGHYRFDDRWRVGFALDHSPEFDVERAPSLVGLQQDPSVPVIDAVGTSTELKSWVEWNRPGRWEWFWLAGVGANRVDIDPVQGPLAGGGTFDIVTDTSTELILVFRSRRAPLVPRKLGDRGCDQRGPALCRVEVPRSNFRSDRDDGRLLPPWHPTRLSQTVLGGELWTRERRPKNLLSAGPKR